MQKIKNFLSLGILLNGFLFVSFSFADDNIQESNELKFIHPNTVKTRSIIFDAQRETRNPFIPLSIPPHQDIDLVGKLEIEVHELNQYKLTAIVQDLEGTYKANFVTPSSKGFLLSKGARIGDKGGIIKEINKENVVVNEEYIDLDGNKKNNEHIINLRNSAVGADTISHFGNR